MRGAGEGAGKPRREQPLIATVIGDPAGIGPEVCVKALAAGNHAARHLLIGSIDAVRFAAAASGISPPIYQVEKPDEVSGVVGEIAVLDHGSLAWGALDLGQAGADSARAGLESILLAD